MNKKNKVISLFICGLFLSSNLVIQGVHAKSIEDKHIQNNYDYKLFTNDNKNNKVEYLMINDELVKYEYLFQEDERIVIMETKNGKEIAKYDIKNDTLYLNNKIIETETLESNILPPAWRQYNYKERKINVSGMTLAGTTAAISAATGIVGGGIPGVIAKYIDDNIHQLYFSYKIYYYYDDSTLNHGRPFTKAVKKLYYGKEFNKFLGTF
ncbi:hypothetical protein [Clostridium rectalis]|uniref:hypothetical protein n=1 Tax=Clostridium rectalis TaxID=2040295 RepID=UPI000F635BE3|nr:hypothetical protein [Clostridium rectalis]